MTEYILLYGIGKQVTANFTGLRLLVDARKLCAVGNSGDLEYATLSYAWGALKRVTRCVQSNIQDLMEEDALVSFPIPLTIIDMVKVCNIPGIRPWQ